VYSSLSRLTSATNPETGTISYTYYPDGNLLTKVHAGVTITSVLDHKNQLTSKTYSDTTPGVGYTYDAVGRPKSVNNGVSRVDYVYDALGRVQTYTQTTPPQTPYGFTYGFNLADALTSVQYPSARQITYGYEAATNRVSSVTGTQAAASTTYALSPISYFAHGGLNSMTLGNGLVESWIFNEALQPPNINLGTTSGSSNVMGLSLVYCPAGGCTATNGNNGNVLSQTISH